jgi:hypothetical protein
VEGRVTGDFAAAAVVPFAAKAANDFCVMGGSSGDAVAGAVTAAAAVTLTTGDANTSL